MYLAQVNYNTFIRKRKAFFDIKQHVLESNGCKPLLSNYYKLLSNYYKFIIIIALYIKITLHTQKMCITVRNFTFLFT